MMVGDVNRFANFHFLFTVSDKPGMSKDYFEPIKSKDRVTDTSEC